jgi:hypothetical protein
MIQPVTTIEHVAHPEWGAAEFSADAYEALHHRYGGTPVSVVSVANALVAATAEVHQQRHSYEGQNYKKLLPVFSENEAYQEAYFNFAGQQHDVGHYLTFFGAVATTTLLGREDASKAPAKITLQLGGKRQYGDWDCTHDLDEFARTIPAKVQEVAPVGSLIQEVGDQLSLHVANQHNRYEYRPLLSDGRDQSATIEYGIVRRRRPAANILLPGRLPIEIFKESRALLITSQTDEYTRNLIDAQAEELRAEGKTEPDSELAAAAGYAFERAIKELKGKTRDILPVSADYFATARNPAFFPGVELHLPKTV